MVIQYHWFQWERVLKRLPEEKIKRERVCVFGRSTCRRKKKKIRKCFLCFVFLFRALKVKYSLSLSLCVSIWFFYSLQTMDFCYLVLGLSMGSGRFGFRTRQSKRTALLSDFPNMRALSFCNIMVVNLIYCGAMLETKILCEYSKLLFVLIYIYIYYKTEAFDFWFIS